jgi:glyoxylase-like metal-dependent hydrolase (beta-lactamase superfamily II)
MEEVLPGIFKWSWYSEEKGYDFNGHWVVSGKDRVLIDPPPMSTQDEKWVGSQGAVNAILLTNRDHVRDSDRYRGLFSAPIWIHEKDAPLIEIKPDHYYRDGDRLTGGCIAVHVPDNKSPGETALYWEKGGGIMILGDALIGKPDGRLSLMPPEKYVDAASAREGIRVLLTRPIESVLVGDGVSILKGGSEAILQFVERR